MAASAGVHSYGTLVAYGDATTTTNNLAEVIDVSIDGFKVNTTNFSHLASDNATRENKPGMGEPPMVSITINYNETVYAALVALYRLQKYWRVTFPDSSYFLCYGHITELPINVPDDDRLTCAIKLQTTGKPTYTVV